MKNNLNAPKKSLHNALKISLIITPNNSHYPPSPKLPLIFKNTFSLLHKL